jgi:hypothetical protein
MIAEERNLEGSCTNGCLRLSCKSAVPLAGWLLNATPHRCPCNVTQVLNDQCNRPLEQGNNGGR